LKGSSEIEIPVVENLTFFNCAETEDTPMSKMRITRKGKDLLSIKAPLNGGGILTTESDHGQPATKKEKEISPQRPSAAEPQPKR
jgi:hypothetical protein